MLRRIDFRDQAGVTLPELLVAMTMAMLVSLGVFGLVETVMKQSGEIAGRVDATQRGRVAMESITRQIRSQVCPSPTVPPMAGEPIASTPDGNTASFYADLASGATVTRPEIRTLAYDARRIVERTYAYDATTASYPVPTSPTRTRVLLDGVIPDQPAGASTATPIFRYYAYNTATPPRPERALAVPLSATDRAAVARIVVRYRVLPPRATAATRGDVVLEDEITVRRVNPNDLNPQPVCPI